MTHCIPLGTAETTENLDVTKKYERIKTVMGNRTEGGNQREIITTLGDRRETDERQTKGRGSEKDQIHFSTQSWEAEWKTIEKLLRAIQSAQGIGEKCGR